jgi:pimeloyl-ACP methyl ester carboxylesterase
VATAAAASAVLVVGGWGSPCCDAANSLHAMLPEVPMRQFSYVGVNAAGKPVPSGASADDLPLPELGDRLAAQVSALSKAAKRPVAIVAESEGTLGVYAMLARHPSLPVSAVVLLSPIVGPGQLTDLPGPGGASVSEAALNELNHLVGGMSPYGPSGAQDLLSSVSEFGGRYFDDMIAAAAGGSGGKPIRVLTVIPLADALTLPECDLPLGVIVVPAFHGGLLGDPAVLPMVSSFLSGHDVATVGDGQMREAAEVITGAATAWRMPDTGSACPYSG